MIGATPLHLVLRDGQLEIVRLLLEKGADVTIVGNYGWTPLHFAASRGHTDVVQVLLSEKGVDVKIVNEHGQTPLHCAAACGHAKIVQVLLSANSDPYSLDFHNFQSLHMAARRANIEIVRLLLNDGIPATAYDQTILDGTNSSGEDGPRNIDGTLVLHAAAVSGNLEVFNYCLNMGFSLRQRDRHGKTVLEYVCLFASDELIERILKLIGPIDCQDRSSYPWSLLHLACRKGSFKTLKLLYDAGFRVWSVKTSQPLVDWAPLDIARYCSNTRLIAQDGTILEDLPWSNIAQSGLVRANDETGTIEGVFKNSLKPSRKSFTGGCDGCLSVSQILKCC